MVNNMENTYNIVKIKLTDYGKKVYEEYVNNQSKIMSDKYFITDYEIEMYRTSLLMKILDGYYTAPLSSIIQIFGGNKFMSENNIPSFTSYEIVNSVNSIEYLKDGITYFLTDYKTSIRDNLKILDISDLKEIYGESVNSFSELFKIYTISIIYEKYLDWFNSKLKNE